MRRRPPSPGWRGSRPLAPRPAGRGSVAGIRPPPCPAHRAPPRPGQPPARRRVRAAALARAGAQLSSDELLVITRALDAKHLPSRVDRQSRVEVAADRLDEANETVAKLDVGPRAIDEIRKGALEIRPWESPSVAEQ